MAKWISIRCEGESERYQLMVDESTPIPADLILKSIENNEGQITLVVADGDWSILDERMIIRTTDMSSISKAYRMIEHADSRNGRILKELLCAYVKKWIGAEANAT